MPEQPTDRAALRRANLAWVIGVLREQGGLSRAQLAVLSGLSKATVSTLVTELTARRLVRAGGIAAGGQGRPGQIVELDPDGVRGIGVEVGIDHIAVTSVDTAGQVVSDRRVAFDVLSAGVDQTVYQLAEVTHRELELVDDAYPAGITVSVPGLVDTARGVVRLAPRLRWREVPLADSLAGQLGFPLERLLVDNDANLSAMAEYQIGGMRGTTDLVYVTGDFGIGAGVIAGGRLVRGAIGYAGEVGHMSMDPMGPQCSCGRRGCWETQVGLGALFHALAAPGDLVSDPNRPIEERMAMIRARAERGDQRTLGALHQIGSALGVGVSIVVNVLSPAVVVLGGYFAALPDWLIEPARIEVAARAVVAEAATVRVVGSDLGFAAARTGGALAALNRVYEDPTEAPERTEMTEAPA
ncbi:ROK family transcriptional regulator [Actinocrispum wychmicini]|uniref:Putative NBD/HSP70 family sugar kinase n=1 Tax=Actinocrispum wychmicini TaxID=1213861 RepID=A0A4V2S414_9PSEU|nr:ROK family transcriptional regulator [Actinocrispum wychmicini]TCO46490.1 putative NBD/HSP70 family sugar kinase [Actinocrispum wychmicini]